MITFYTVLGVTVVGFMTIGGVVGAYLGSKLVLDMTEGYKLTKEENNE